MNYQNNNGGSGRFQKKEGSGKLFFEGNKKRNVNGPDWTGYIMHNGEEVKVAGWVKPGGDGSQVNLKVSQMRQDAPQAPQGGYQAAPRAPQATQSNGYRPAPQGGYPSKNPPPLPPQRGYAPQGQPQGSYVPPGPGGGAPPPMEENLPF